MLPLTDAFAGQVALDAIWLSDRVENPSYPPPLRSWM